MDTPLLQTKLHIPPVRAELIARPRLIKQLHAGLRQNGVGHSGTAPHGGFARKLTLVSAPAGFGKTTLLSEWVCQLEAVNAELEAGAEGSGSVFSPVAWLSLDASDNDPVRFLTYMIAALQRVEARLGEDAADALLLPHPPPRDALLTALINQIDVVPHCIVLVLDDYHVITAEKIHSDLAFLLDHLPTNLHLVIATRSDPPLNLARLRGRGQLNEIRQSDLSFTVDEATRFFAQVTGTELDAQTAVALASRTEGWIVGLQMAALAVSGLGQVDTPESTSQFIEDFTGSNRYVLDYLVEEVLNRQRRPVQDFLMRTSILNRLCGPLCDAVSTAGTDVTYGSNGSDAHQPDVLSTGQAILEQLEHANMFIVPLDSERRWYRYHHLFADLLRQRLMTAYPDEVPKLHSRASEWYEDNGLAELAVEHALAARDIERAARLIEQAAEAAFTRGRFATLHMWLEGLPDDVLFAHPLLCVFHVLLLLLGGHPLHEIEVYLKQAERADTSGLVAGQVTVLHAVLALFKGATRASIELSHRALALLPEEDMVFRGLVARNLASVHKFTGDAKAAIQALDEVRRMSEKAGDRVGHIVALQLTAEMRAMQGRLREAKSLYEEALKLATDSRGRRLPVAVKVLIGLGELLRQWNDLEAAAHHLVQGIELAQQWSEAWGIGGYIILARVKQASGDEQGALEDVSTAERLAIEFDATDIDDLAVAAHQARLLVTQGNLAAAARWVAERGLEDAGDKVGAKTESAVTRVPYYIREMEGTTLARVYLAQARFRRALVVLGPLLDEAGELGRVGTVIEILALQALAFQGEDRLGEAVRSLERALSLAEPEGYVRLFVDEGEPMARLLRDVASRGTAVDYVRRLLAAFDASASETEDQALSGERAQPLIEPLSERELEILQLFSEGLTNREVAQQLYLSLHTVKWHAGNIYGKLAVTNRAKAVAKARALAILPTT